MSVPDPAEYFGLGEDELDELAELGDEAGIAVAAEEGAEAFVAAIARGNRTRALEVLAGDYAFASERHRDLLEPLDPPTFPAGWGRRYLLEDPDGFEGPPLTSTV